jgi:FhaA, N-terminal domain/FHA domain
LSVLRAIEHKIEALVEGVFGRAFRTNVQPVELARKLVKEMDDHRTVSVSRVYVPNEYTIYLSPHDRSQFQAYEDSLKLELQEYLAEHARREGYVMLSPPSVLFSTDADLGLGVFGIATRMVQRERKGTSETPAPKPAAAATMVYRPKAEAALPADAVEAPVERESVWLTVDGERHPVDKRVLVLGRAQDCDVQISDPNVSRRHAELRQEETSYWIVDLGSTNGMEVNGQRLRQAKLEGGDRITLGSTDVVFERELP